MTSRWVAAGAAVGMLALAGCGTASAAAKSSAPTTVKPAPTTTAIPASTTTGAPSTTVAAVTEQAALSKAERIWKAGYRRSGERDTACIAAVAALGTAIWTPPADDLENTLVDDLADGEQGTNQGPGQAATVKANNTVNADFRAVRAALGMAVVHLPAFVAPTTTTTLAPAALVMTISGTGPSSDITLDVNNSESQHTGAIHLPWSHTDRNSADVGGFFPALISAQDGSGSGSATITCTITESGQKVASNTATGPYSIATCTGPTSF